MRIRCEIKQDFNTRKMITGVGDSVAWVSAIQTLMPGDILATGTDHCGLNAFQHGDIVELETEGLGRLRVNVRDDLKRTWSRELRIDRHKIGANSRNDDYGMNSACVMKRVRWLF